MGNSGKRRPFSHVQGSRYSTNVNRGNPKGFHRLASQPSRNQLKRLPGSRNHVNIQHSAPAPYNVHKQRFVNKESQPSWEIPPIPTRRHSAPAPYTLHKQRVINKENQPSWEIPPNPTRRQSWGNDNYQPPELAPIPFNMNFRNSYETICIDRNLNALERSFCVDSPVSHWNHINSLPFSGISLGQGEWCRDVIEMTRKLVESIESKVTGDRSLETWYEERRKILAAYKKGIGQIYDGYRDSALQDTNSADIVDFSQLGTQLAYVYKHFSAHVLSLGELLLSASGWSAIDRLPRHTANLAKVNGFLDSLKTKRGHVTVSCFGGGPGCDIAAVAAWLRIEGVDKRLQFNIVDKYNNWSPVANTVAEFCDIDLFYKQSDFLLLKEKDIIDYVKTQDIIVMSKFLSALTAHRVSVAPLLRSVLTRMRPGALFVYFDNSGGGTTKWLMDTVKGCEVDEVFGVHAFPVRINPAICQPYLRSDFNVRPKVALSAGFKVLQKRGGKRHSFSGSRFNCRDKGYERLGGSSISFSG